METGPPARMEVLVLGPPMLAVDGGRRPFPAGRPGRLLAALVLARGRVVAADRLVDLVWDDATPEDARASLHTTVNRARRALGPAAGLLVRRGPGYALERDAVVVDADRFLELATAGRGGGDVAALDGALALWRGPAWAGFDGDLAVAEAGRLEEVRLAVREERAAALLDEGRLEEGITELRALVAEAPLRERPVGLLMRALHAGGDVAGSLQAYDDHRTRLADELGLDPSAELAELHGQVLRRTVETPVRGAVEDAGSSRRLHGRDGQLAALRSMLAERRCVTVVGPGGVGKTSVAAALAAGSPDAFWVDLARVADPSGVPTAVADALDARSFPGGTLEAALRRRLETATGVLVLDNCEHLLGPCADLVEEVVSAGPGLRVLATSRERLGVVGEQVFVLPPLQLPEDDAGHDPESMPAVALFLERAAAVAPELEVDRETLVAVNQLVHALDGLPLAIELAAGRLGSVTLDDLRERLGERLDLLRSSSRRAPARQRTLTATVDWSFALLDAEEQRVFLGLSAFAGPFDLAGAEAVLGPGAAHVVADLVDRSLVVRPGVSGRGRYRLLETLRAYARSHLSAPAAAELRSAHAAWAADVAQRAAAGVEGPEEGRWSREVEELLPDLALAFRSALTTGDVGTAAAMVAALQPWAYYHLHTEVLGWAHEVLATGAGEGRTPGVLAAASSHCWMTGRFEEARRLAAEGVEAGGGAASAGVVRCLGALGDLHLAVGAPDEAHASYSRGTELAEAAGLGPDAAISACGRLLARVFAGREHTEELDRMRRLTDALDHPTSRAFSLYGEGEALAAEDPEGALDRLARAVALAESVDNRLVHGVAMTAETALRSRSGRLDRATLDHTAAAVRHWFGSGNENLFTTCLRNVVPLLGRLGAHRQVTELVAALAASSPDRPSYGPEAQRIEACVTAARQAMGEEFSFAWRRGAVRTTTEAAREVLATLEAVRPEGRLRIGATRPRS
jgi:predicted ATPase/DNA-binding SARP family transcriptional activator